MKLVQYARPVKGFMLLKYTDGSAEIRPQSDLTQVVVSAIDHQQMHLFIAMLILAESHPGFPETSFWHHLLRLHHPSLSVPGTPVYDAVQRIINDICAHGSDGVERGGGVGHPEKGWAALIKEFYERPLNVPCERQGCSEPAWWHLRVGPFESFGCNTHFNDLGDELLDAYADS